MWGEWRERERERERERKIYKRRIFPTLLDSPIETTPPHYYGLTSTLRHPILGRTPLDE